eukprot:scaffold9145_cov62-Phaeocystis_antarctica.AAC.5
MVKKGSVKTACRSKSRLAEAPERHCTALKSGDRSVALEPSVAVAVKRLEPHRCGQVPPRGQDGEPDGSPLS